MRNTTVPVPVWLTCTHGCRLLFIGQIQAAEWDLLVLFPLAAEPGSCPCKCHIAQCVDLTETPRMCVAPQSAHGYQAPVSILGPFSYKGPMFTYSCMTKALGRTFVYLCLRTPAFLSYSHCHCFQAHSLSFRYLLWEPITHLTCYPPTWIILTRCQCLVIVRSRGGGGGLLLHQDIAPSNSFSVMFCCKKMCVQI